MDSLHYWIDYHKVRPKLFSKFINDTLLLLLK